MKELNNSKLTATTAIDYILHRPVEIGQAVGFIKLTELHNEWIQGFVLSEEDETLLAHRGSYKTTCLSIAIALVMFLFPHIRIIFLRKTDTDVMEVVKQVQRVLTSDVIQYFSQLIYGRGFKLTEASSTTATTDLVATVKGSVQLLGIGSKSSITGKHGDWIITDDIVNKEDRKSAAERKRTKELYYELQNIKNKGGRFTNTGTPWHKEDAISFMPNVRKYDCYTTGLLDAEQLAELRASMPPSWFAANYELKHIASEDALFDTSPVYMPTDWTQEQCDAALRDGKAHIDAAYGGEDGSVLTLMKQQGDTIYVLGKRRNGHIDKCLNEYIKIANRFMCSPLQCERNADKGYLAKEINRIYEQNGKTGVHALTYHEKMNKYTKISTYAKKWWKNIEFHPDTDKEYINEILDYTEDAEHDDSPDSLASILRRYAKGRCNDKI